MYDDMYAHKYLSHYSAGVPSDFFLFLDRQTEKYSVGYLGGRKNPMVILMDDERLALACVEYLSKNNVSKFSSLAEAEARR